MFCLSEIHTFVFTVTNCGWLLINDSISLSSFNFRYQIWDDFVVFVSDWGTFWKFLVLSVSFITNTTPIWPASTSGGALVGPIIVIGWVEWLTSSKWSRLHTLLLLISEISLISLAMSASNKNSLAGNVEVHSHLANSALNWGFMASLLRRFTSQLVVMARANPSWDAFTTSLFCQLFSLLKLLRL